MHISAKHTTAALSLAAVLLSSGAATAFGLRDAFVKFEGNTILSLDPLQSYTPGIRSHNQRHNGRWVQRPPKVTVRWSPESGILKLTISTGCLQTTAGDLADLVKISLDRKAQVIRVEGAFWYSVSSKIQTKDCRKTKTYNLVFRDVPHGTYSLRQDAKPDQTLTLAEAPF